MCKREGVFHFLMLSTIICRFTLYQINTYETIYTNTYNHQTFNTYL